MSTPTADASEAAAAAQETPVVQEIAANETPMPVTADAEVAAPVETPQPTNDAVTEVDDAPMKPAPVEDPQSTNKSVEVIEEATKTVGSVETPQPTNDAVVVENAPKKRGRKRKVSVAEEPKAAEDALTPTTGDALEKSTEESVEKPAAKKPAKKAKAATTATPKKKMGRPRKIVKDDSETEDELEISLNKGVEALPEDVKAKFGTIVWAKMVGFPYWPGLITDPRRLDSHLQTSALKDLDTKYMVCFYESKNFATILFKNVELWEETTHPFREGHPAKDAKAPKRRSQLMAAIEEADKEVALPIEERMGGLLKVVEVTAPPVQEEEEEAEAKPTGQKRKIGRPLGSKNKQKTGDAAAPAAAATATTAAAPKAKRGRKKAEQVDGDVESEAQATPETPEEHDDEATPALSKDEIKAKVASRKTPSKKKTATPEEKLVAAAAKKAAKTNTSAKGEKSELDSKRKKEIELVVPRKSVKSADIREATDEAARKKSSPREKPKDKGDYKVGNLTHFAGKMNRLYANESSKNNDELIQMLTKFFDEKPVYRSDMERSGVAGVVAVLRKSANPTVSQTASAVRRHLIDVLVNDVGNDGTTKSKKTKAGAATDAKPAKKQKTDDATAELTSSSPVEASEATKGVETDPSVQEDTPKTTSEASPKGSPTDGKKVSAQSVVSATAPVVPKSETTAESESNPSVEQPTESAVVDDATPTAAQESSVKNEVATEVEEATPPAPKFVKTEPAADQAKPASPVKTEALLATPTVPKPDPSGDKSRMTCIDMLKRALEPIGEKSAQIAREIEAEVFDCYNESNQEYQACARSIVFGLKKNATVRERLNSGSVLALELVYSREVIFKGP